MDRKLDWSPRFDERSRNFAVSTTSDYSEKRIYRWPPWEILDQGREGACVGFACAAVAMASPERLKMPSNQEFARGVYNFAKYIDYWEGEDYEGTSVLAGAKTLHHLGVIAKYEWCFGTDQIITALNEVGPVVLGVPWHSGMYKTDEDGYVNIHGEMVGGHAIMVYAYHPRRVDPRDGMRKPTFYWRNSWGKEYGKRGTGYITKDDLASLLDQQGEACVFHYF